MLGCVGGVFVAPIVPLVVTARWIGTVDARATGIVVIVDDRGGH